jgi:carnitine 3-dehydrogenase
VEQGIASVEDVDTAIAHGPGLRWALLGPFLNLHLSGGAGGIAHVLEQIDPPSPFDTLATWQRHLADVRRLSDDTLLKAELIKTAKEAIESRTNRSYLPDTRAGGLQCRSSLHGHDHSRHRWGIDLYLGRR